MLARRILDIDLLLAGRHFLDITARLAKKILELRDTFGIREESGIRITVKITQKDLASMIGSTRERINKQFKALRDRGLIGISDRTQEILNREMLVCIASRFPIP